MTNDVKSQLKFLAELDSIEKKRKDEAEREKLMKAAKVKLFIRSDKNWIFNSFLYRVDRKMRIQS